MQRAYLGDSSGIPGIDTAIGVGIICNTAEQAERYVSLIGAGQESEPAIKAVNMEEKNPHACGIAAAAFRRTATLDTKAVRGKLMQIVRVNILAGFDGINWQPASGRIQYAVTEPGGMEI